LPKTRPDISRDTEETLQWTMEWPDGAVAEFLTSYQQNHDEFRAEGAKGWIEFSEHAFGYKVGTVTTSRGPLHFAAPYQQALQMDDFAQCVQTGRATPVPGEMGRRDLTIIEAIYRAAASGRREAVKPS
jgi:glucose-fructose oxidoreductase